MSLKQLIEQGLTQFLSILAFRQHHYLPTNFNCSDLYFICCLNPLTFDLQPCPDEVLKCQWMRLEDLATSDLEEATPLSHRIARLTLEGREKGFSAWDWYCNGGMCKSREGPIVYVLYSTQPQIQYFLSNLYIVHRISSDDNYIWSLPRSATYTIC